MTCIGEKRRRDRNKFRLDSCFLDEKIAQNYKDFEKKSSLGLKSCQFEETSDNENFIVDYKQDV